MNDVEGFNLLASVPVVTPGRRSPKPEEHFVEHLILERERRGQPKGRSCFIFPFSGIHPWSETNRPWLPWQQSQRAAHVAINTLQSWTATMALDLRQHQTMRHCHQRHRDRRGESWRQLKGHRSRPPYPNTSLSPTHTVGDFQPRVWQRFEGRGITQIELYSGTKISGGPSYKMKLERKEAIIDASPEFSQCLSLISRDRKDSRFSSLKSSIIQKSCQERRMQR